MNRKSLTLVAVAIVVLAAVLAVQAQETTAQALCSLCFSCGGDYPIFSGSFPTTKDDDTAKGARERGDACAEPLDFNPNEVEPFLCCQGLATDETIKGNRHPLSEFVDVPKLPQKGDTVVITWLAAGNITITITGTVKDINVDGLSDIDVTSIKLSNGKPYNGEISSLKGVNTTWPVLLVAVDP